MINNSILICRAFGIPIRAHILLLVFIPYAMSFFSHPDFVVKLLGALGIVCSVAAHELGHSIVARAKGSQIMEIVLYPFGGAAKIANIPKKPKDEILVALAGPAVSLLLAIIGILAGLQLLAIQQSPISYYPLVFELGAINLVLFVFNLIPAFPMDGGRVLRAVLQPRKNRLEATRIAAQVGKYFCILFVVLGLLMFNLILAFIGGYLYVAGQTEYRMVQMEHQASYWGGHRDEQFDVEVSPPPYAQNTSPFERLKNKVCGFFRRK